MRDVAEAPAMGSPVEGRVFWDPVRSLWNGGMLATAVVLGPMTITASAVAVAVTLGGLGLLGVSVGLHRLLAHGAFRCGPGTRRVLAWLGVLAGLGGPVGAVRAHHESDWAQRAPDCHDFFAHRRSTLTHLIWRMHGQFVFVRPPTFDLAELERDPVLRWLERTWMAQQMLVAAPLYLLGGWSWVVWGVFVRVAAGTTGYWLVAHLAHAPGPNRDGAKEGNAVVWAGVVSMGEAWHDNHHAFPGSARIGLYPGQSDWGFRFIQLLERLGLAWDVRTPETMAARKVLARAETT